MLNRHVILAVALIFQLSLAEGQTNPHKVFTLEKALETALNNPALDTTAGNNRKLIRDLKSAWYQWLFTIHKWQTLTEYSQWLNDLSRVAALHYQTGEIEPAEESSYMYQLADVQTHTSLAANDVSIQEVLIRQLLYSNEAIVPYDTVLSLYLIDKGNPFLFPCSEPGTGNDTVLINYHRFTCTTTIEVKQLELDGLFLRLQFFHQVGLPHADNIIHTAKANYDSEEIGYLELVTRIAKAYEIKLEYLETVNQYNQNAINLEYYAY